MNKSIVCKDECIIVPFDTELDTTLQRILYCLDNTYCILFISTSDGRGYYETREYLIDLGFIQPHLIMRECGDTSSDVLVREDIYNRVIEDFWNVLLVLDAGQRNVAMWRSKGLTCYQTDEPGEMYRLMLEKGQSSPCVDIRLDNVVIERDKVADCLQAINALHKDPWLAWVQSPKKYGFASLTEALNSWRYEVRELEDGSVLIEEFTGWHHGEDERLYRTIAPFVRDGGTIIVAREYVAKLRYLFNNATLVKQKAVINWEGCR